MKQYCTLLLMLLNLGSWGQDLKGIWVGYLDTDVRNITALEVNYVLHIKDQDQNIVNGKAYLFRDNPLRAEGILDFIGIVKDNLLNINELKILHSKIPSDSTRFLCIKQLKLRLSKENQTENLNGTFTGAGENMVQCFPGNAYLQRFNSDNQKNIPPEILSKILLDGRDPNVFLQTKLARPVVIEVQNNVIQLEIRDYLKEDGDIVSVYHNRRPFIRNQAILNKSSFHTLRLNRSMELHEIIMYAENLGQIPPNTSNLIVYDGTNTHQVMIRSSKEVSAVVYLRYVPEQKSPSK